MGRASSLEKDPTPQTWNMLFNMARQQTLLGVLNDAAHSLPVEQQPPEDILERWDRLTGRIEEIHSTHEKHTVELEDVLARLGLHGCILKGTGLARLYPNPGRRQCGDIDVWVPGPRKNIIKAFSKEYPVHDVIYQECKVDIFDDTEVEVHFHPAKLFNPFSNARLQRWFEKHSPFESPDSIPCIQGQGRAVLCYPDAEFNTVFCMAHMYRHYLVGGLGLRQMMDYYYVLRELPAAGREPAMRTLKRLGMGRFTAATMLALQYNFGLEDEYLLCEPDRKLGPQLIEDLIKMGNFGVLDPRNRGKEGESALARFRRKNRRVFSNLRHYPREVLWAPFARLSQYFWRLFLGYL